MKTAHLSLSSPTNGVSAETSDPATHDTTMSSGAAMSGGGQDRMLLRDESSTVEEEMKYRGFGLLQVFDKSCGA